MLGEAKFASQLFSKEVHRNALPRQTSNCYVMNYNGENFLSGPIS